MEDTEEVGVAALVDEGVLADVADPVGEVAGASATLRKSVLAGACAIGVNTAFADVGAAPGMNCTTTLPPVPVAPVPVHMYNT